MKSLITTLLFACFLLVGCKSEKPQLKNQKAKTTSAVKKSNTKKKAATGTKKLKPKNQNYWKALQKELGLSDAKLKSVKQINRKFTNQKDDLKKKNLSKTDLKVQTKQINNRMQRHLGKVLSKNQLKKYNTFNKAYM